MKKLLFLPLLLLIFACSADSEEILNQNDNAAVTISTSDADEFTAKALAKPCFSGLYGSVSVDVSGGFGNPVVVFQSIITSNVPATTTFRVRTEVQALSDCDDMDSDVGLPVLHGPTTLHSNVVANPPSVSVLPAQLPSCYKWRIVFEAMSRGSKRPACISVSDWYEAPLF